MKDFSSQALALIIINDVSDFAYKITNIIAV